MRDFEKMMDALQIRLYWTEVHGCTLCTGELVKKEWFIVTNDADFDYHFRILCDQSHATWVRQQLRPQGTIPRTLRKRWKSQWEQHRRRHLRPVVEDAS